MADLEYSITDGVGTILLNRPHRKNAFTMDMIDQWAEILRAARTDSTVRVVVVTGAGDAFCSGVDLGPLDADAPARARPGPLQRKEHLTEHVHRIPLALEDLDKPVIAAVNGVAVGAGMDMALMCDMRVMAGSARLSEGYIRVGLVPGDGGCYFLPRLVGTAKALELMLTGDFIGAEEAGRLGIANRVVEDGELTAAVAELASKIATAPPVAVRAIKRAVYQSSRTDLRTALDLISSHMGVVTSTDDSAEAFAAFREKRAGRYVGH
ncbi:MAG: enoyl-CoA hydratase/isomerase family protein [Sciscionella sp.]